MNDTELESPNLAKLLREISEQQDKEFDCYLKLAQKAAQQGKTSVDIKVSKEIYWQVKEALDVQEKYSAKIYEAKNNTLWKTKEEAKKDIKEAKKLKDSKIKDTLSFTLCKLLDYKFDFSASAKDTIFGTKYILTIYW